ncbi:MAG: hypothetical protein EZS28_052333, partial [Streblomastix strix]
NQAKQELKLKISLTDAVSNLKQIMRQMLNKNENQALKQNHEKQIQIAHSDMLPLNSGPLGQLRPGLRPTGPYIPRNAERPQAMIFPPALNTKQQISEIVNVITKETIKDHMHRWMLKRYDLNPLDKDDKGQYQPDFSPCIPHATDRRKFRQQELHPSMEEVKAFQREYNFELRLA